MKTLLLNLWAWVASDPLYALGAVLVGLVTLWKALPAKHRAAIELRYPRPVGLVRTLVALLPDLIGAARVMRYQTVAGQPRAIVSDRAAAEAEKLRAALAPEPAPERETIAPDASGPRSSAGYAESAVLAVIALAAAVGLALSGCSPTLPADLYRGVGVGVAVTARGGRELALLEARECLAKPSRGEAEACLVPWRARWVAISAAWQGAASSAQSLAHVVRSVDASLERRWPAMDAGAASADAGSSEGGE